MKEKQRNSSVLISGTTFEAQMYEDPIQSIRNLHEAALMIRTTDNIKTAPSEVIVIVDKCTFHNNERGLTFIGPFKVVNVTSSTFRDNIAMHAGAGILFLADPISTIYVIDSVFERNAAGSFHQEKVKNHTSSFQINGDEVKIQSVCSKGVVAFVGKGGAIRIQRGRLVIIDSQFRNNTARLLGGAVYVERESFLTVDGVYFENSVADEHSLEGDLVYSNGEVVIKSAKLVILSAQNHVALFHHSGTHWSLEITQISVRCPGGHRLRMTNTSAYGVTSIGLRRSHKLDQLSYFCESCPRNKYSLEYGFFDYDVKYHVFAHFTLLINGESPEAPFYGTYVYRDITCQQCPYGGRCFYEISAVPNFWGYTVGSKIRFQHCPKGYCCAMLGCKGYDWCAPHRTGTLCGRCELGYSEALFSPECLPDHVCDSTWLWPVMACSGVLYFLFLFFQKDIRDLMFLQTIKLSDIKCDRSHESKTSEQHTDCPISDQNGISLELNGSPVVTDENHEHLTGCCYSHKQRGKRKKCQAKETASCREETAMLKSDCVQVNPHQSHVGNDTAPTKAKVDMGASFLIIVFFYFQDAQLLQIKTVFAATDGRLTGIFRDVLTGLFKFRIEIFQFVSRYCFLSGLTPTSKLLIRILLVPYVLIQFGIAFIVYRWLGRKRKVSESQRSETPGPTSCFATRLATGFVLSLLFMYQKLATTSFTMLNCVPVENRSVLYIDGTIDCYQNWQYAVITYAITCIVPFCLVLLLGPGLLKHSYISGAQFYFACIVPLPMLIHWMFIKLRVHWTTSRSSDNHSQKLSTESRAVVQILQGPFKDIDVYFFGPLCGQGILIARRLILVLLYTFVTNTLMRMLYMVLFCFVMLLHHVHALPYKDRRGNIAGTLSAAALVVAGGINLIRAGFEAAEYDPQGSNKVLMKVFDEVENALMLWMPALVMAFAIFSLSYKLVLLFCKYTLKATRHSK